MKLKTSLNFRGFPKESKITFFDGIQRELEVDNFHALWDLLNIIKKSESPLRSEEIDAWKVKNGYDQSALDSILNFLKENGLTYINGPEDVLSNRRNFNFFNIYDRSENAGKILKKIKDVKILIIGVGTIGSTLAVTLAKLGIGKIILVDCDVVEEKNIVAQMIFNKNDIGKKKIDVVKDYINSASIETDVLLYHKKIEDIKEVKDCILGENIDFIFNCFDDITQQLHIDLYNLAGKFNINYVSMGYAYDSLLVYKLDTKEGIELINDSYNDFDPTYVISENRGTILQSLIGAMLGSHLLLTECLKEFNYASKENLINFNIRSLEVHHTDEIDHQQKFIDGLSSLISVDNEILIKEIKKLQYLFNHHKDVLSKSIENEILNLYQFFQMLVEIDALKKLELENTYKYFLKFISDIQDEEDSIDTADEDYVKYLELIDEINIEEEVETNIHNFASQLKDIPIYEHRIDAQKKIHNAIKEKSKNLLEIMVFNKKSQLETYSQFDKEELLGIKDAHLQEYEEIIESKYSSLFSELYSYFYPNENGKVFDYLDVNENIDTLFGDFEHAKNNLEKSLEQDSYGNKLKVHINEMYKQNNINIIAPNLQKNINKTVYFPLKRQNKIIINYDETHNTFYNFVHEIGHSFYNLNYSPETYFEDSNRIVNEILAIFFEFQTVFSLLKNDTVKDNEKHNLSIQFLERISKLLLSNFSIYYLEKELIEFLSSGKNIEINEFLEIQNNVDKKLLKDIVLKNSKYNQLNILLYPYFTFNLNDYVVDSIAVLYAANLFIHYKDQDLLREYKLKEFMTSGDLSIEKFTVFMFNREINSEMFEEFIINFLDLCKTFATCLQDKNIVNV